MIAREKFLNWRSKVKVKIFYIKRIDLIRQIYFDKFKWSFLTTRWDSHIKFKIKGGKPVDYPRTKSYEIVKGSENEKEMASCLHFIFMFPPLGGEIRSFLFKRGRESNGEERGEIKGLSRKEGPVLQGRFSVSAEWERSKEIQGSHLLPNWP